MSCIYVYIESTLRDQLMQRPIVLFLILVKWIQMTPSPVCFGATGNSFGSFTNPSRGRVITFKLIHRNGYLQCAPLHRSHWGCYHPLVPQGFNMGTHITDSQKNRLLPKVEFLANASTDNNVDCLHQVYYSLPGLNANSSELLFDNFSVPRPVSARDQSQIWFGEDFGGCPIALSDNAGETCAKVYGLFV